MCQRRCARRRRASRSTSRKHLSDTPRGRDIRLRLGEVKLNTETHGIFFEIKSRQPY